MGTPPQPGGAHAREGATAVTGHDETSGSGGDVVELGADVFALDTRMSGFAGITAAYLVRSERPCLVETGTATSADQVVALLAGLGVGPADLATIAVTHIHLDHAGGVGDLAASFPRARIVVQERGAAHLADPTRLLASARRVFGPVLDDVFGLLAPTPADRLDVVDELGSVDLGGGRRLEVFHSPGHASHHVGLLDSATGDLYVGDAAGVYVPETAQLRPATPPPDFDLELALGSLDAFAARQPTRLLFSHFGPVSDVGGSLAGAADELHAWVAAARTARAEGLDLDHALARVVELTAARYPGWGDDPAVADKFEFLSSERANVTGILRYLDRAEPAGSGLA